MDVSSSFRESPDSIMSAQRSVGFVGAFICSEDQNGIKIAVATPLNDALFYFI